MTSDLSTPSSLPVVRPPAPARAPPHYPFFVFFFCTFCRCLFGDAVASLPDEFFDDDELMVGLGSAKSCKIAFKFGERRRRDLKRFFTYYLPHTGPHSWSLDHLVKCHLTK